MVLRVFILIPFFMSCFSVFIYPSENGKIEGETHYVSIKMEYEPSSWENGSYIFQNNSNKLKMMQTFNEPIYNNLISSKRVNFNFELSNIDAETFDKISFSFISSLYEFMSNRYGDFLQTNEVELIFFIGNEEMDLSNDFEAIKQIKEMKNALIHYYEKLDKLFHNINENEKAYQQITILENLGLEQKNDLFDALNKRVDILAYLLDSEKINFDRLCLEAKEKLFLVTKSIENICGFLPIRVEGLTDAYRIKLKRLYENVNFRSMDLTYKKATSPKKIDPKPKFRLF